MARIPTKEELGGEQYASVRQLPQFRAQDFSGTAAIGRAVAGAGEAVQKVAVGIAERKREEDDYEIANRLVQFDLDQEKRLDDEKRLAGPEAKDFTKSYREKYDEDARTFMETVPDRLKPKVDQVLWRRGANYEKRAYDYELRERDRYHTEDVQRKITDFYNDTTAAPDRKDTNAERGLTIIRGSRLPINVKRRAEREFLERNDEHAARALLERMAASGEDLGPEIERLRKMPVGSSLATPSKIGSVSAKYESGGKGVGFVSTGDRDPGGPSYGVHQLSSKDSMPAFLRSEEGAPYRERFRGTQPGTASFTRIYQQIAKDDAAAFENAQKRFYTRTHFEPAEAAAKAAGFSVEDKGVQEALYSISIQHGGAKKIIERAQTASGASPEEQIRALFDARAEYVKRVPMPEDTRRSLLDRYGREVNDAVALAGQRAIDPGEDRSYDVPGGADGPTPQGGPAVSLEDPQDEPVEDEAAPYRHLTPATRRKLLNIARTAQRAVMTQKVDGAIVRVRRGEELEADEQGRTAFDKAVEHMAPMQRQQAMARMTGAKAYAQATRGLADMPADEADAAIDAIRVTADTPEDQVAAQDRAHRDALVYRAKIEKMRKEDPAHLVWRGDEKARIAPAREVMEAREKLRSLDKSDPDYRARFWEIALDARVAAQRRTMPDKEPRLLTKTEAQSLLQIPKDMKVTDKNFRMLLQKAGDTASVRYGLAYARPALQDAIRWVITGDDEKRVATGYALSRIAMGERMTQADLRRMKLMEEAAGWSARAEESGTARTPMMGSPVPLYDQRGDAERQSGYGPPQQTVAPKPQPATKRQDKNPFDDDD